MIRALALLAVLVGCASSKPAAKPTAAPAPESEMGTQGDAPPASCDEACTEYAICYEEVYGGEYTGGSACVEECEQDEQAYFTCIANAADCQATVACPGEVE
jgi:hypothetical protein